MSTPQEALHELFLVIAEELNLKAIIDYIQKINQGVTDEENNNDFTSSVYTGWV